MCTSRLIRSQNLYARAHKSCAPDCWVRRYRTNADQSPILSCFAKRRPTRNGQTRAPRPTSPARPSDSSSSCSFRPFVLLCGYKVHYGGQRAPVKFEIELRALCKQPQSSAGVCRERSIRESQKGISNANSTRRPATSSHTGIQDPADVACSIKSSIGNRRAPLDGSRVPSYNHHGLALSAWFEALGEKLDEGKIQGTRVVGTKYGVCIGVA